IKTKKEMNLPQLIERGWKNKEQIERKEFKSNVRDSCGNYSTVQFSVDGYGFKTDGVSHKDTFTVEIEEEITEDTVLPRLVKYTYNSYYEHRDKSINMLDRAKEWSTFYYKDDNENMYLIWRDGKLVE